MKSIEMTAYGKINLGLDVKRKLENGYHELDMVMQTVTLADTIGFEVLEEDEIILTTNQKDLSTGEDNLVYQAIAGMKEEFQIKNGIKAHLIKNIPMAAGMAGGSADCAAALEAMNLLFELGLSKEELMERGVKYGADVPYCIQKGTARAKGIGEKLTALTPFPACHIVLAKPAVSVSTKFIFEHLDVAAIETHPDMEALSTAVEQGDLQEMAKIMGNVLEEVTIKYYPKVKEIKEIMLHCGALNALMTGSGPTVFGIFNNLKNAQKAQEILENDKETDFVIMSHPC
ncbi:MAG: 4-(cytidine 5'-diphospho)-2-C-methyl-D-erythritol kinase [Lachnospiraceae bacterium]|nr:4-(cytidine 5'-diphospho)-2-C-methyl-D-erythritol kinase [Lachnospiraceae bacterium]